MKKVCWISLFSLLLFAILPVSAQIASPITVVRDSPTIAITTAAVDTTTSITTSALEAEVQFVFGTVAGSYSGCTVQAKTSLDDGAHFLTLGSAASVTVSSGAVNAWHILAQGPTTTVTTSAVSSTAALGFGAATKYNFSCSGGYGTSAPATIFVIYR